jgi:hypothetical protein
MIKGIISESKANKYAKEKKDPFLPFGFIYMEVIHEGLVFIKISRESIHLTLCYPQALLPKGSYLMGTSIPLSSGDLGSQRKR